MRKIAKLLVAASFSAMVGAGAAVAADPAAVYTAPASYAAPASGDWDGFYLGVFGGGGIGTADHTSQTPGNDISLSGGLLGVSAGAMFYLSDKVVGGVETDLAWSNMTGSVVTGFGTSTHTIDWTGSVRGVVGYDAGAYLPYLTGGLAVANATRTTTLGAPNSATATHIGATIGAGVQIAATDSLVVDLQYRYSTYPGQVYVWSGPGTDPTVALDTHTFTVGLKMPIN